MPGEGQAYGDLLKGLTGLSTLLFIMGGFAEQVLLFQALGGPHADLDILTTRSALSQQLAGLRALGLGLTGANAGFDIKPDQIKPGQPLTLATGPETPQLEIWVATPASEGGYHLAVPGPDSATLYQITLPEDTFDYPATQLRGAGLTIRTISPLALYHLRAVSAMTRHRHVLEKRTADRAVQDQLRAAFLGGYDEEMLTPRLVRE